MNKQILGEKSASLQAPTAIGSTALVHILVHDVCTIGMHNVVMWP